MSDPFIAEIKMFGGNFAPRNYAFCDGQLLPIAQNTALFSLVGTIYGGDGQTTLALPDLRGRVPVHQGSGPGLDSITLGEKGGDENLSLSATQIPAHTHAVTAKVRGATQTGDSGSPAGNVFAREGEGAATPYSSAATDTDMGVSAVSVPAATDNAGSSQSFNIRSPYQAITFIIALVGVFPSSS